MRRMTRSIWMSSIECTMLLHSSSSLSLTTSVLSSCHHVVYVMQSMVVIATTTFIPVIGLHRLMHLFNRQCHRALIQQSAVLPCLMLRYVAMVEAAVCLTAIAYHATCAQCIPVQCLHRVLHVAICCSIVFAHDSSWSTLLAHCHPHPSSWSDCYTPWTWRPSSATCYPTSSHGPSSQ